MHIYQTANPALSQLCWVSSWEQTVSYVKLGVKSCWILWLEHTFLKDKTGIMLLYHWEWNSFLNYGVLMWNQSHYPFPLLFPLSGIWRYMWFLKWSEQVACLSLIIYMVWLKSWCFRPVESWNVQYAGFAVHSCKREETAHSIYRKSCSFYP